MKDKKSHKKIKYLPITSSEKKELEDRIFSSIKAYKLRRRRIRLIGSIAASIVFMCGLGIFIYQTPGEQESIMDYVNTNVEGEGAISDKVTLILGKENEIKIDEETDVVSYSKSGQNINVGSVKTINQNAMIEDRPIYNTLLVPYGKKIKTQLSDGTLVWLNSGSKLIYPAVFKGSKREVYIEGEAIFDVAHNKDKPFYVLSENQQIKVLGTVFGITNYVDEGEISTVLESGSVEIKYSDGTNSKHPMEKFRITPGTKASYDKQTKSIMSEKVDVSSYFAWREGYMFFKNDGLRQIMNRIARYYNVKMVLPEDISETETYSGYLNLNDGLEKVMQSIKESTNVNYQIHENQIIIN